MTNEASDHHCTVIDLEEARKARVARLMVVRPPERDERLAGQARSTVIGMFALCGFVYALAAWAYYVHHFAN